MILDEQFHQPFENRRGLKFTAGAGLHQYWYRESRCNNERQAEIVLSGCYKKKNQRRYHQTASSPDGTGSYPGQERCVEEKRPFRSLR